MEHARVLLQRVRVERRHHAAGTTVADADQDTPGTQAIAGPVGLLEPLRAGDHDVRAEAAAVDADLLHHRLRHDRERQHVVALPVIHARRANQLDARPGGCPHELARRGGRPRQTVDRRLAVLVERSLQPEQPRPEARRDDAPRLLPHMHEAVAGDAVLVDVGSREALAPERLDRIPPQLRHPHLHGRRLLRGDVSGSPMRVRAAMSNRVPEPPVPRPPGDPLPPPDPTPPSEPGDPPSPIPAPIPPGEPAPI